MIKKKKNHRKWYRRIGATEVQILLLSRKITVLTEHLQHNSKDFVSYRGLKRVLGKRKRLFLYLSESDLSKAKVLIEVLKNMHLEENMHSEDQ
jgi:small subunit ribosomal protein S15